MQPLLNPQVTNLKESATLAINQKVRQMRQAGQEVCHLGFGQSPFPVPSLIVEALQKAAAQKDYLPSLGLPELRQAVARFYQKEFGYSFTAEEVIVGPGSKELIFQLLYILEGPLLIPAPSWVSYGPQAALRGKEIIPVPCRPEKSYRLQAEDLEKICYQRPQEQKILILNNPNNPTGAVYQRQELADLAEICRAYQVLVISDEIYAMLDFSGEPHHSLQASYPEGCIITGGLSKAFSAGGYRLGVMLLPPQMTQVKAGLTALISETFSAVSAPIQHAALAAYQNFDQIKPQIARFTQIHQGAGLYLHQRFTRMGLACPVPQGAFYLFPDFSAYGERLTAQKIKTSSQLCHWALEKAQVAMLPGSDFYMPATHLSVRVASVDYEGTRLLRDFPNPTPQTQEELAGWFPSMTQGCDRLERLLETL